jgi:hypothetical protein
VQYPAGKEVRLQRIGISFLVGPQVHGDQVGPEPSAVPVEVDDVVGADVVGCPEAGEALALRGSDGLRAGK